MTSLSVTSPTVGTSSSTHLLTTTPTHSLKSPTLATPKSPTSHSLTTTPTHRLTPDQLKRYRDVPSAIAPNDPIHLALTYATSLKPLSTDPNASRSNDTNPSAPVIITATSSSEKLQRLAHTRRNSMAVMLQTQLAQVHAAEELEQKENHAAASGSKLKSSKGSKLLPSVSETPSTPLFDPFARAAVLKPLVDKTSFLTKSSHLNPNARLEAMEIVQRRRQSSTEMLLDPAATANGAVPVQSSTKPPQHSTVLFEDPEDLFWRDLMIKQSQPGTEAYERQQEMSRPAQSTILDRESGIPIVAAKKKDVFEGLTSDERMMMIVNQLRSKPHGLNLESKKLKQTETDPTDSELYTYSTNTSLIASNFTTPNRPPRTYTDERGFVRSVQKEDGPMRSVPTDSTSSNTTAGSGESGATPSHPHSSLKKPLRPSAAQSKMVRIDESKSSDSNTTPPKDASTSSTTDSSLVAKLAQLDYEYEFESDSTKFFRSKYQPMKIHPTWLKSRDDFKMFFGQQHHQQQQKALHSSTSTHQLPSAQSQTVNRSSSVPSLKPSLKKSSSSSSIGAAALAAAQSAHSSTAALDAIASQQSPPQQHSRETPVTALDLLALHAAEKPPSQRTEKDKANIALLLSGIEYFARLPVAVRAGLAEYVQLQRASKDEVLFTRIHGTKFMYVYSGSVVSSSSITGPEFASIQHSTAQIKTRILAERAKKQRALDKARLAAEEAARVAEEERLRHLAEMKTPEELAAEEAQREKEKAEALVAALAAKGSRILGPSRSAMKERGEKRASGWSTAKETTSSSTPGTSPTPGSGDATSSSTPSSPQPTTTTPSSPAHKSRGGSQNKVSFAPSTASTEEKPNLVKSKSYHTKANPSLGTLARSFTTLDAASSSATSSQHRQVRLTPQQQQEAAARALLSSLDTQHGEGDGSSSGGSSTEKEIRGFQIGLSHASVWSLNMVRPNVAHAAAAANSAHVLPTHSTSLSQDLRHLDDTNVLKHAAEDAESVAAQGMVFHRVLKESSLFGQSDLFENSYAGIDRIIKLKNYQMRLSRLLSEETTKKMSSGWIKLKTLVHIMITARDKSTMDSVVAYSPCMLFTWLHKDLEKIIVTTKEKNLNNILNSLQFFRDVLFTGWSYKMILNLSSIIELKEFPGRTVLYQQGHLAKPVWDEKNRILRSGKEVFEESCERAREANRAEMIKENTYSLGSISGMVSNALNNFGHNPVNHNLYLLTDGMLQLEKSCTMQRYQRWPASKHTWELKSTVITKKFFAGFIRGREIIGGEAFLGMEERDFTVSVPPGQTATCIVIRRATFEHLAQKRIEHAVWTSCLRLRELAATTIDNRIKLRNYNVNHGTVEAVKNARATSTRKTGRQNVNEYLLHILRGTNHQTGYLTRNQAQAAITHLQQADITNDQVINDDPSQLATNSLEVKLSSSLSTPSSTKNSAAFAPTIDGEGLKAAQVTATTPNHMKTAVRQVLNRIFASPDVSGVSSPNGTTNSTATTPNSGAPVPTSKRLIEDLMKLAAENVQAERDERVRQKQAKLYHKSEQIIADVVEATAGLGEEKAKEEPQGKYVYKLEVETEKEEQERQASAATSHHSRRASLVETLPKLTVTVTDEAQNIVTEPQSTEVATSSTAPSSSSSSTVTAAEPTQSTPTWKIQTPTAFLTPQKAAKSPNTAELIPSTQSTMSQPPPPARPSNPSPSQPARSSSPLDATTSPIKSPPISSSTLGKLHAHHRSISSYINNLPIRKEESAHTIVTPPQPTAQHTISPYTPSPLKKLYTSSGLSTPVTGNRMTKSQPPLTLSPMKRSSSNVLLSPNNNLISSLPHLLSPSTSSPALARSTSPSGPSTILSDRSLRSFSRQDARAREALARQEEAQARGVQSQHRRQAEERKRLAAQQKQFRAEIQAKLGAYEEREKEKQAYAEAVYAAKLIDISRRLQANLHSSFYDNPFGRMNDAAALEISRNQAKLRELLQSKAKQIGATESGTAGSEQHLTAAELESLGIILPPPPLPVEDLSLVSKEIWAKHIRYLTDLEAEQRLIFAEYMTSKRELEASTAEHDHIRIELLNKRYLKGLLGEVQTAHEGVTKDVTSKHREKADAEWRAKQELDALNDAMLAMGAAGDEEAEAALANRGSLLDGAALMLNQNLKENTEFTTALLDQNATRPLALDAMSRFAASLVANDPDSPALTVIKPALQMELSLTDEPPITDVLAIPTGPKMETHSDIVPSSDDVLFGSHVGLYFPPLPPPPERNGRQSLIQRSQPTSPRHEDEDADENEDEDPNESGSEMATPTNMNTTS